MPKKILATNITNTGKESKSKKVKNITGVHSNYDIPKDPDIKIDTSESDINNSISKILNI